MNRSSNILDERRAGVLLHITSLPETRGNGDLGSEAYRFIEFLAAAGITVWQTLPLGPTHSDGSPYQCLSVHAGNPLLINLEWLAERGWLDGNLLESGLGAEDPAGFRLDCLRLAHAGFVGDKEGSHVEGYTEFCQQQAFWLNDFALFMALRVEQQLKPWHEWPALLRDRDSAALDEARSRHEEFIARICFEQYVFFAQWHGIRAYAHEHSIHMFGDMPIFVSGDSSDVWASRQYFALDEMGQASVVAGVPPDYFSATGQRWGNPHYDWEAMQADGFDWWIKRLATQLDLFDWVRIDHFRGFEAYWEIPAESETAIEGRWVPAPGRELLSAVGEAFESLPLVAEDLGIITPEVEALRDEFNLPGMKILQFAFGGGSDNAYLPHNHVSNCVVYTGTHDNDTTLSWYESIDDSVRGHVDSYLGYPSVPMPMALVQCALASVAQMVILPMQDLLGLGAGQRMNTPGTIEGNWSWRFNWDQVSPETAAEIRQLAALYGRTGS